MQEYLKTQFIVYADRSLDYDDKPKKKVCVCLSSEDYKKNYTTDVLYTISECHNYVNKIPERGIREEEYFTIIDISGTIDSKIDMVKQGYFDCLNIDIENNLFTTCAISDNNLYTSLYPSYSSIIDDEHKVFNSSAISGIIFLDREVGHKYHEISLKKKYDKNYLLSINNILIDKDYNPSVSNFFNRFGVLLSCARSSDFANKFLYDDYDKAMNSKNYILKNCAELFDYKMKAGPIEYHKSGVVDQNLNIVIDLVESINPSYISYITTNPFVEDSNFYNNSKRNCIIVSEFVRPMEEGDDEDE